MNGDAHSPGFDARRRERTSWWSWFMSLALLCLLWGIATPLFGAPDEASHVIRAAAVGRGELGARDRFVGFAWTSEVRAPATLGKLAEASACFSARPEITPGCVARVRADPKLRRTATIAGRYPPLYYLGSAPVARLFPSHAGVAIMRVLAGLACSAFLASALVSAQRLGSWAILGVAAAITPLALYLGGAVNPSGLEIASAVCLWASAAAIARAPSLDTRLIVRATIAAIVFANSRSLSLPMAGIALLLPLLLANRDRARELAASTAVRACAVAIGIAMALALAWVELRGRVPTYAFARHDFTLLDGLSRSWRVFQEGIAWFGAVEVRDLIAIALSTALWGILMIIGLRAGVAKDRIVLASVAAIALAFPIAVSFAHPPPIYTGWQGRHGLPLWVGFPIVAGAIAATGRRPIPPASFGLTVAFAGAIGVEHVSSFATAAHRYAVGRSGRVLYFLHPLWRGPVPPLLLLGLMVCAAALLVWRVISSQPRMT
jgi:hypothetical protein